MYFGEPDGGCLVVNSRKPQTPTYTNALTRDHKSIQAQKNQKTRKKSAENSK